VKRRAHRKGQGSRGGSIGTANVNVKVNGDASVLREAGRCAWD